MTASSLPPSPLDDTRSPVKKKKEKKKETLSIMVSGDPEDEAGKQFKIT